MILASGPINDFHVYSPASMTWFNLSSHALGTPPTARNGHGFTSAGGLLYVHGGVGVNTDEHTGEERERQRVKWGEGQTKRVGG